jgi:hypothetical protein
MKTISIRQPWADAIIHAGKDIENRSWTTSYRGPLLIHAAATVMPVAAMEAAYDFIAKRSPIFPPASLPPFSRGGIVGVVDLVDIVEASDSPWFVGRYGWVLKNPRPIETTPLTGRLGLFEAHLCSACGNAYRGKEERAIHRDGFGVGPEVALGMCCGGDVLPTCESIWERIALRHRSSQWMQPVEGA